MTINSFVKKWRSRKNGEDGLTLIELVIVVIVLGLIAAIMVPVFTNQQRASMNATVQSDLRNVVGAFVAASAANGGRFLEYVPNNVNFSADNSITIDTTKSSIDRLCLVGYNKKDAANSYSYYDSLTSRISDVPCSPLPAGTITFSSQRLTDVADDKILLVYPGTKTTSVLGMRTLAREGYTSATAISEVGFLGSSDAAIATYDAIYVSYFAYGVSDTNVRDKLLTYYNSGGKIVQEGNDTGSTGNPFIESASFIESESGYSSTNNSQSLQPAFPFTFQSRAYVSAGGITTDLWSCNRVLRGGAVPIATWEARGETCITMFAAANDNSGRWVTATFIDNNSDSNGVGKAAFAWINQQ